MMKYSITIDVEHTVDSVMIKWKIDQGAFSPPTIEVLGVLERVKYLIHEAEDYDIIEEDEESEEE